MHEKDHFFIKTWETITTVPVFHRMDENTASKIKFLKTEELSPYINPDIVPWDLWWHNMWGRIFKSYEKNQNQQQGVRAGECWVRGDLLRGGFHGQFRFTSTKSLKEFDCYDSFIVSLPNSSNMFVISHLHTSVCFECLQMSTNNCEIGPKSCAWKSPQYT